MKDIKPITSSEVAKLFKDSQFKLHFEGTNSFQLDLKRECTFAKQIVLQNKKLQYCTPESITAAVIDVALTGLSLNPVLQQAYMVPFRNNNTGRDEAVLMPGYQGFITKMVSGGAAIKVSAHLHYQNDDFDIELGTEEHIKHKPYYMFGKEPGEIMGAYAVAFLPGGEKKWEYMPIQKIFRIRDNSKAYIAALKAAQKYNKKEPTTFWVQHEEEMIKKTVVRRLWKAMPKLDNPDLSRMVELDNVVNETVDAQHEVIETKTGEHEIERKTSNSAKVTIQKAVTKKAEQNDLAKSSPEELKKLSLPQWSGFDLKSLKAVARVNKVANYASSQYTKDEHVPALAALLYKHFHPSATLTEEKEPEEDWVEVELVPEEVNIQDIDLSKWQEVPRSGEGMLDLYNSLKSKYNFEDGDIEIAISDGAVTLTGEYNDQIDYLTNAPIEDLLILTNYLKNKLHERK